MAASRQLTLRIFKAPSGYWSGHLIVDGIVIGAVSGCATPEVVEQAAREQGFAPDHIESYIPDA
jgi:hypothetical protein